MNENGKSDAATAVTPDDATGEVLDVASAVDPQWQQQSKPVGANQTQAISPKSPEAIRAVRDYMEAVKNNLLTDSDYERVGGKTVVRASGYAKVGAFVGLSEEILSLDIQRDGQGNILYAQAHVRVTHANGRYMDGWGACATKNRKSQDPEHDVPATAVTRAFKRAVGRFVGGLAPDSR